jgi:hypothetical protein
MKGIMLALSHEVELPPQMRVLDHFLTMRPGDMTPLETGILVMLALALLVLCIWLQSTLVRASDRLIDRWFTRK